MRFIASFSCPPSAACTVVALVLTAMPLHAEVDTDSDGLPDDYELAHTDPPSTTALDPTSDLDTDGITAIQEYNNGTDPNDADSDQDGLSDGVETDTGALVDKTNTGTDPLDADTDNDGVGDYYEVYASFTNPFLDTDKPPIPYPLPDPDESSGVTDEPVKVYIMSGQSNMVGMGIVSGFVDKSLDTLTVSQNRFPDLVDESGAWTTRQDVRYRGVISDFANVQLSPGNLGTKFGPELGFGYVMGWYHDEPVLLLKSCTGNRSLGWDVLPPGSVSYQYGGSQYAAYGDATEKWTIGDSPTPWTTGSWYAGKEFDRFFTDESEWAHPQSADTNVVDILDNFATEYPDWATQGFQIAGFVWWQGDKDRYDMGQATRYEENLVKLIDNLRSYYTNRYPGKVATNAPFVLATLGQTPKTGGGNAAEQAIIDAQLAVDGFYGDYLQYANNVTTVYSHPLSEGGESNGHYNERAGTYLLVGDALGRAMVNLIKASALPDVTPPAIVSRSPGISETNVPASNAIVIGFDERVVSVSGNISLVNLTDGGQLDIDITDTSQVTAYGGTLTLRPKDFLLASKEYAVLIGPDALDDPFGNSFPGILLDSDWRFTTADPDPSAPTIVSTNPVNGSAVSVGSNMVATFSEPITIGTGNIILRNLTDGTDLLIDVTDANQVAVSGSVLTINPSADLPGSKNFVVRIDASAIDDLEGHGFAGIGNDVTWFFSTSETPATATVILDELSVAGDFDGEVGDNLGGGGTFSGGWVNTSGRNLEYANSSVTGRPAEASAQFLSLMDHQRSMALDLGYATAGTGERYKISFYTTATNAGTDHGSDYGELTLYYTSNNLRTGTVVSSVVLRGFTAADVWTHTSTSDASFSIDPGAGKNLFLKYTKTSLGDNVAGETVGVDNISVALVGGGETTPPTVNSRNPGIGATDIAVDSNIVVNFNEPVTIGTGNISILNITDGGQIDIDVTDGAQVSVSGSTMTVNPTSDLLYSKQYAVLIDATAIDDTSGNSFAGILVDTEWRFTTGAPDLTAPTLTSTDPVNGATDVASGSNLVATFSEPVSIGTGNITLRNLTDGPGGDILIAVTDGTQVSVSGAVLTINPSANLLPSKNYAVRIDATAIDDLAGNSFSGIADDVTWAFSVPALPGSGYVILDELSTAGDFDGAAGDNLGSQGTFSGGWVNTSGRNLGYANNSTAGRPAGASNQILSVMDHQRSMALDLGYATAGTGEKYNISFYTIATATATDHGSDYGELTLYYTSNNVRTGTVVSSIVLQGFTAAGVWTHTTASAASFSIDPGAGKNLFLKYTKKSTGDNVAGETIGIDNISVALSGGASNTFANWISGYPAVGGLTGFDDDFDQDGIGNGLENYFGTDPGVFSAGVVPGNLTGNTFTFTHPLGESPASDITAVYRWSKDLASFHADGATSGGSTVTFSQGTPNAGMVEVTVTVTGTPLDRLFVTVGASQN